VEVHVAGGVPDSGVGVGRYIVEELCKGLSGGLRAFGLIRGDCYQGDQHGALNGTGTE
jgi:hypothetical protein